MLALSDNVLGAKKLFNQSIQDICLSHLKKKITISDGDSTSVGQFGTGNEKMKLLATKSTLFLLS